MLISVLCGDCKRILLLLPQSLRLQIVLVEEVGRMLVVHLHQDTIQDIGLSGLRPKPDQIGNPLCDLPAETVDNTPPIGIAPRKRGSGS